MSPSQTEVLLKKHAAIERRLVFGHSKEAGAFAEAQGFVLMGPDTKAHPPVADCPRFQEKALDQGLPDPLPPEPGVDEDPGHFADTLPELPQGRRAGQLIG